MREFFLDIIFAIIFMISSALITIRYYEFKIEKVKELKLNQKQIKPHSVLIKDKDTLYVYNLSEFIK